MRQLDAMKGLLSLIKSEPVIHANGFICRESFSIKDRPQNFYMLGSMGLASSIGLGLATCLRRKKIVVFDGDGNLLMNLGSLAMASYLKAKNYVHVVFDNESYSSTGAQPTISKDIDLAKMAKSAGYKVVECATSLPQIKPKFKRCIKAAGPNFLLIKVQSEKKEPGERVSVTPEKITRRFAEAIR